MKAGVDFIGVSVGAMIINEEGKVLLCKRSKTARNEQGQWEIPGGEVEFGEKLTDAIHREMKEELDIDIELVKQLPAADHIIPADHQHWVPTTFLAKLTGDKEPRIMEPDKCDIIGWFSFTKLPSPLTIITDLDIAWYRKHILNV
jgi:8-oxo-dGTP diphosphatase